MNNNKQSSVIWFAIESWKLGMQLQNQEISKDKHSVLWVDLLVKAKAMHKEEIEYAYDSGLFDRSIDYFGGELDEDEQHYNKTYGGNK